MSKDYVNTIIRHYEECLEKYGDTHLGVDWPNLNDAHKRYRVMLDIMKFGSQQRARITLLDFGCGTGHLLDFIRENRYPGIDYSGLDISEKFVSICRSKFEDVKFYAMDVLTENAELPAFDFIVMNGVFTEKRQLTFDRMWVYFFEVLEKAWSLARMGIAFNVMSKNVDWERDDLFHVPLDMLTDHLCTKLTRNFVVRNDYGLYEYTVYLLKK